MFKDQLIELMNDEISLSGSLPFTLPEDETNRIINDSLRYFYQYYDLSVEERWYVAKKDIFKTKDEWKRNRAIKLPDCVMSTFICHEIRGGSYLGILDREMSEQRLFATELFLTPFTSDDLMQRTAYWAYWDLTKAFFLREVQFNFNINTHQVIITGRDPQSDICLRTLVKIPEEYLFDDPLFVDYVKGKALVSMGRILTAFNANLIGDFTINPQDYITRGEKMIADTINTINGERTGNWFWTFN